MRHTKFNRIVQMAIWQKRAACISFTPELAQKPIVVRLITPVRNSFYGLIIDRFGHRAAHITLRGLGIDIKMVDHWISTVIDRASMVELRQMDFEQGNSPTVALPQNDPRFVEWKVCDPREVSAMIASLQDRKDCAARTKMLERLAASPVRMLPRVTKEHIEAVRTMALSFPNFDELTTEIIQDLSLKMRIGEVLSLPHLLLHGPPGTGKSLFARRIAEVLGFHYREFSFAQLTAGFLLTGSSDRWMSSSAGILADAVISAPAGKVPLIFGDEIDKAVPGRSYPADTALLNVLEPSTAATFTDEYLGCAIDFRP
ncbi:ATP-binding protein, partial [Nevskia ramosa]|uniref:ATP-binding protein n=1 Tax=Nevskia ramosa TaxID=64002 RepID=UPI002357B9A1